MTSCGYDDGPAGVLPAEGPIRSASLSTSVRSRRLPRRSGALVVALLLATACSTSARPGPPDPGPGRTAAAPTGDSSMVNTAGFPLQGPAYEGTSVREQTGSTFTYGLLILFNRGVAAEREGLRVRRPCGRRPAPTRTGRGRTGLRGAARLSPDRHGTPGRQGRRDRVHRDGDRGTEVRDVRRHARGLRRRRAGRTVPAAAVEPLTAPLRAAHCRSGSTRHCAPEDAVRTVRVFRTGCNVSRKAITALVPDQLFSCVTLFDREGTLRDDRGQVALVPVGGGTQVRRTAGDRSGDG
jgi:hypothetical protein